MRMSVVRQAVASRPPQYNESLLAETLKAVSQVMQMSGVRAVFNDVSDTAYGTVSGMSAALYFDRLPPEVSAVSAGMARAVSGFLADLGVRELSLSEEAGDRESLAAMWESMSNVAVPPDASPGNPDDLASAVDNGVVEPPVTFYIGGAYGGGGGRPEEAPDGKEP